MYLRRHDKRVNGEAYGYWSLVESIRTARGPRQRIVATIGKLPGLDREERIGWDAIGRLLTGQPPPHDSLFEQATEPPVWATIDLTRVRVERLRHFGDVYLALLLWHRLGLATWCAAQMAEGRAAIPWSVMACLLTIARFCAPSSELRIADSWYAKTACEDLLGVPTDRVNDDRLYRALDALLPHNWEAVHPGVEVKKCTSPEGGEETFVLCRSDGRKAKEAAILDRFITRLEAGLHRLQAQEDQGRLRDRQKAERRIGRLLERNSRAASLFTVTVTDTVMGQETRLVIEIIKHDDRYRWMLQSGGSALLRTNWQETDPKTIWTRYIRLTEVEDAFRIEQSELGMRPIYHQRQDRTQAHILVCFLALAMWRTLQQWMKAAGLGTAPRQLLKEMREVRSLDVLLPAKDKTIRLRVVSTPSKELRVLLQRMNIFLPNRPKIIGNVVQKTAFAPLTA
jgi:hypothetical protein